MVTWVRRPLDAAGAPRLQAFCQLRSSFFY